MVKNLSTFTIAKMLHVDPGSVANWIDQNLLKAHRTPGGHRRVREEDLLEFLRRNEIPIPTELHTNSQGILIVDDDPAAAGMISSAIKSAHPNCRIMEARDGFHAGTLLMTFKPQVMILDAQLAGVDAMAVCKMVKSQEETRHTQVLAVTDKPSSERDQRILECGAKACLSLPLDIVRLLKEVAEVL